MRRSRAINAFGAIMTGVVLLIVLVTKFLLGAWIAIAAMAVFFVLMQAIQRHYDRVAAELVAGRGRTPCCPRATTRSCSSRTLHKPDAAGARLRPGDAAGRADRAHRQRRRRRHPRLMRRVGAAGDPGAADGRSTRRTGRSPGRSWTSSSGCGRRRPRDVVTVFIPEYVVGHWWEHLLHNQSALRLKGRLLFEPGVMVTSVPWQLASSERMVDPPPRDAAAARSDARLRGAARQVRTPAAKP